MPEDSSRGGQNELGASKGLIHWDATRMSTGQDSIDSQHRELISRINEFHTACVSGVAKEELIKLLGFLGEYAQSHFRHEEEVMQHHRCPVQGKNKAAHLQFLSDYGKLVEMVKEKGASTSAVLQAKTLLGDWLKNHICGVDTKLRGCGGKGGSTRNETALAGDGDFRNF
jgi:hemerythrin